MKNIKFTKRALIGSVISLVLCFAMLLGTTYAWFTAEDSSDGNVITTGTLKVNMKWANGTEDPATATFDDTSAMFYSGLWEPGYAEAKHVKIENTGSLALKYRLAIANTAVTGDLHKVIDVYYFDTATQLTRATLVTPVGTLEDFINGIIDIEGNLSAGDSKTITLVFKMQESAGNGYQGKTLGSNFSLKLLATQYNEESDSFDPNYDIDAELPTP
ncbi:MAG: hypothetical protein IJW03_05105 [Clostridia bacterium]|nr:hypothetical protein [Clostridia bacterium]